MLQHAAEYFVLAREREHLRRNRASGAPWPWTRDPIYNEWRFCNVRREDDKTTEWFRGAVRDTLSARGDPQRTVEGAVIFRWFNLIETGEAIKDLLLGEWDSAEAHRRLAARGKVFTGAYKISHHSRGKLFTGAYIIKSPDGKSKLRGILECIDKARELLTPLVPQWGDSLEEAWADLQTCPFMGGFMAYEVISDLRWTHVLSRARDIATWANAGPGCARGLSYVYAGEPTYFGAGSRKGQAEMLAVMRELLAMSRDGQHWPQAWAPWEMREVEHWACEYWKYIRCRDYGQPPRGRFRRPAVALLG